MPSPKFLNWCSVSISSIHKSIHGMINNFTKTDFEISPYIAAIQSLNGITSGEKYKDLNLIVIKIIQNTKDKGESVGANDFRDVSPAMVSKIKIAVGNKLRIKEIIIQGLTTNDIDINKKAMSANWFFYGANDHVNVDNFIKNIMPFVSLNTRLNIIKKLSYSLDGFEKKAENFFNVFVELYGIYVCLPILTACSESFVYEKIFEYRIKFPIKTINILFKKYPNLVIKYLQLGNKNNSDNANDRNLFQIEINEYDSFIERIIKNYPKDFIELYELTPEKALKFGKKLSTVFMQNLKDEVLEKPNIFLKLLSPPIVQRNLNESDCIKIIEKLLPKDETDFNLKNLLDYCKYFPQVDVIKLLQEKYKTLYNKDLLDNELCLHSKEFMKLLKIEEKHELLKNILKKYEDNDDFINLYSSYLPPNEIIPVLIKKIKYSTNVEDRVIIIGQMFHSCSLYQCNDNLLKVLEFYNNYHKNERNLVLCSFFQYLYEAFDLKSLEMRHWLILKEIIFRAHVKKELFNSHVSLMDSILEAEMFHTLTYEKKNKALIDKIFDLIVECKIEHSVSTLNILTETEMERQFLEKFFKIIPIKYPEHHSVWEKQNDRLSLALSFVKSINNYNERNHYLKLKKKSTKNLLNNMHNLENKLKIENYEWLINLIEEFFMKNENKCSVKRNLLMKLIKINAPDLYEEKMDKYENIRNIESGEALKLLKDNSKKILDNWTDYLLEARKKIYSGNKAARRFIAATRWYHEIPVKFIEKCLFEIREKGSINILAILLERDIFQKIITPYVPENEILDLNSKDVKINYEMTHSIIKAMNDTSTPISFEAIASFCKGDYALLTENLFVKSAQYIPTNQVIQFALELLNHTTPMKKQSFRLFYIVATKPQLKEYLEDRLYKETNSSMQKITKKMIFNLFIKSPNVNNWKLMKLCIESLSIHDEELMGEFSNIEKIDNKFLAAYIDVYLTKIESTFSFNTRIKCISLFLENLDESLMYYVPEDMTEAILQKYFFDVESAEISRITQHFAIRSYLLQAGEKFEFRLNVLVKILLSIMEKFDIPQTKKPRMYAANYTIREFFNDIIIEISCCNNDNKLKIIDNMLNLFNLTLSNWQEPSSYLSLNLFREYLLSKSPNDFGSRCAKRIFDLMEDFSKNEIILSEIVKCLEDFINTKIYQEFKHPNLKLSIINGMIVENNYYGNMVGINLLDSNEVELYDSRYDEIIKILRKNQNTNIQCALYQHLNNINY